MTRIRVGTHRDTGAPIRVPLSQLMQTHTWVFGSTGSGKTQFIRLLIHGIIQANHTVVVIDGKGDLVRDITRFCADEYNRGNAIGPDRLVILDPAIGTYVPGFNPAALDGARPFARAATVISGLMKVFGEGDTFKPWLLDHGRHGIAPLAEAGLSLVDLEQFLRDEVFRSALVARSSDPRVKAHWDHVDSLSSSDREAQLSAARTRISLLFSAGEGVRRIFASPIRFDWAALFEKKGVLLVNASESAGIDQSAASLLGITIAQKVLEICSRRPQGQRPPVFLVMDEFQEVASDDIVRALAKSRGWGLHAILGHQDLEQIQQVPGLYSAVRGNAKNFFFFSAAAADHAELTTEAYAGFLPRREVVHEHHRRAFAPRQEWMEHVTETETETETENPGAETTSYDEEGEAIGSSISEGYTATGTSSSTTTTTKLETFYDEYDEITDAIETLSDVKERLVGNLVNQPQRHCTMKLGQTSEPVPLVVQFLREPPVSDRTLTIYQKLVLRNFSTADQVDESLASRPERLRLAYGEPHPINTEYHDDDRSPPTSPPTRTCRPSKRRPRGRRY